MAISKLIKRDDSKKSNIALSIDECMKVEIDEVKKLAWKNGFELNLNAYLVSHLRKYLKSTRSDLAKLENDTTKG